MKKFDYEAPGAELIVVCVERGFAQSQVESDFELATEDQGTWN